MGIAPYKTFTFDGVSSDTYGVYITGEGVFNAPERDVEMIDIHGRNGAYAFDNGRFNNISVKYKIGMYDVNESNFATKMSNFRNWLCSKVGYVRLSDEYNPNEYRMAVYSGGLEVSHEFLIAGEAEITFECKPQRWLTSGETATAVANNGTLSNPTLFDASPLLEVEGYGTISFNGYSVVLADVVVGEYTIADTATYQKYTKTFTYDQYLVNNGDPITVSIGSLRNFISVKASYATRSRTWSLTDSNASFTTSLSSQSSSTYKKEYDLDLFTRMEDVVLTAGTDATITDSVSGTITFQKQSDQSEFTATLTATRAVTYTAATREITISMSASVSGGTGITYTVYRPYINSCTITTISTASALGHPTYIDCDIGECWMETSGGTIVTLNDLISLGSDLPTLAPGTNTFSYPNTVTSFKVIPRWWKI